jgi:hypothetical protein
VLAAQSYKPRPGLLAALLDEAYAAMPGYSPAQLAGLAGSLGAAQCKPSVQWMSQLMGRVRAAGLQVGREPCLPVPAHTPSLLPCRAVPCRVRPWRHFAGAAAPLVPTPLFRSAPRRRR